MRPGLIGLIIIQIIFGNFSSEQDIGPDLVSQDKGNKYKGHGQHYFQGQGTGRGIVGRQAVSRVQGRGEHIGIQADDPKESGANNGQG